MPFVTYLHRTVNRENLSVEDAEAAMEHILSGEASGTLISAFLVALRMKGETPQELLGFARAMRTRATPVPVNAGGAPLVDTCGTGGDGACTFNISTVAAFVVAGAGVPVAKHGNRSLSSHCGSADILEALGVDISAPAEHMGHAIGEVGIGFFFAPLIHPAMKHAQPARSELKLRTAFNLLGPLTNPAAAGVQVVGTHSVQAAELIAEALAGLGLTRGYVVHGKDGLDEITTTAETMVWEIRDGAIAHHTWIPEMFGVPRAQPQDLISPDRETNCAIALGVLRGLRGPQRDVVLVNAAAALMAAGKAADCQEAMQQAAESVDSGSAERSLRALVHFSHNGISSELEAAASRS
jgi:anthranilate phosphoribosyltransferase